jgi:predicted deacylase
MTDACHWNIDIPHTQADEFPTRIRVHEITGSAVGPATAIVACIVGDKPLGALTLHALRQRLLDTPGLRGKVLLVPAANPPGLQIGARPNPDGLELNRRFPGLPHGFLTDQICYHLQRALLQRADCIVDLHSGTSSMATHFAYDFGNLELTASFGYVPVMINRHIPGQLGAAAVAAGGQGCLIEFGGGEVNGMEMAIEGCLNLLRYRGHLDDAPTGPKEVAVLDQVKYFRASTHGVLCSPYGPRDLGQPVAAGVVGWVTNVVTGERLEEFVVEAPGETAGLSPPFTGFGPGPVKEFVVQGQPLLMVCHYTPRMIRPGALALSVGWQGRTIPTPRRT